MKFSFKSFAIGFACAALSLGAVTYANAAGNGTLKACANKKTGVMRYIAKGSCKKTETSLSWNQMGPSGLPGGAGTNGETGAKGDKGATGVAGTNGSDFQLIDAAGKVLGLMIGPTGGISDYQIISGDHLWVVNSGSYRISGTGYALGSIFSDSSCTTSLGLRSSMSVPPQVTFGYREAQEGSMFKAGDLYSQVSDNSKNLYQSDSGTCSLMTESAKRQQEWQTTDYLFNLIPITPPTYTAPLTIVPK